MQELLSDSGVGRNRHVIAGQGQLDQSCTPARRPDGPDRGSGRVVKHRKRKEKALRKLGGYVGRPEPAGRPDAELGPASRGWEAEVARKAAAIQAELRDARLLLADDYVMLLLNCG